MSEDIEYTCDHCGNVAITNPKYDGDGSKCKSCGFPGALMCSAEEDYWSHSDDPEARCENIECDECYSIPVLVETLKEREAQIVALKAYITNTESTFKSYVETIVALEQKITRLEARQMPEGFHIGDTIRHKRTRRVGKVERFANPNWKGDGVDRGTDIWVDGTGPYPQSDFEKLGP